MARPGLKYLVSDLAGWKAYIDNGKWDWDLSGKVLSIRIEADFIRLICYSDACSELIIKIGEEITVEERECVGSFTFPIYRISDSRKRLQDWFSRMGIGVQNPSFRWLGLARKSTRGRYVRLEN